MGLYVTKGELCCCRGVHVNFDDARLFRAQQNLSARMFFSFRLVGMLSLRSGIDRRRADRRIY